MKAVGSVFILTGGFLLWQMRMRERRRERETLRELSAALRSMGETLRMTRPPLPWLLERAAERCAGAAADFFRAGAAALRRGEGLEEPWQKAAKALSLGERETARLQELACSLKGDEENICKVINLATKSLEEALLLREQRRREEERQLTAVCFSASALLVILLI